MSDFVQTMMDWRRMCIAYTTDDEDCCKDCPLERITEYGCGAIFEDEFTNTVDWAELERRVMKWAEDHPKPIYPTWQECFNTFERGIDVDESIPADVAQKLGLKPKEV